MWPIIIPLAAVECVHGVVGVAALGLLHVVPGDHLEEVGVARVTDVPAARAQHPPALDVAGPAPPARLDVLVVVQAVRRPVCAPRLVV